MSAVELDNMETVKTFRSRHTVAEINEARSQEQASRDLLSLNRAGKVPVLKRRFGMLSMTGFSCGLMSTWEGLLAAFLLGLQNGGPAGLIYGLFIVWVGNLCLFTNLGELASMIPTSGGQYHWVYTLAPPRYRKFLSYVTGWLGITGWIATVATTSFFVTGLIQTLIQLNLPSVNLTNWQVTLLYWAVLSLVLTINTLLSRMLPKFEIFVLVLHILGFFAVLLPLVSIPPHVSAREVFTTFINGGNWSTTGLSFMIGLQSNVVAFGGADGAIHMAEEIKGATRNIPRSMVLSLCINGAMALAILLAIVFVDIDFVKFAEESEYPFVPILASALNSNVAATILTVLVLLLQFAASIASLASASRMLWAFSRDRGVPGWRFFSRVSNKTTIPVHAVLICFACAFALGLINIGSTTVFNDVISLAIAALSTTYLLSAGLLLYRRIRGDIIEDGLAAEKGEPPFSWGPWHLNSVLGIAVNSVCCAFMVIIIFFSFWPAVLPVTPANMNYSQLVWGFVIIASVLYYLVVARKHYKGPIVEVAAWTR